MENRYSRFFESIKQLLLQAEFSKQADLLGVGSHVIVQLEKRYDLIFPLSLKAFLVLFGKKFNVPNTDGFLEYTVSKIEKAMQMAENENIVALLKRKEGIRDWTKLEKMMIQLSNSINIDNILFLQEREMGGEFTFIDYSEENPALHFLKKEYVEIIDDPDSEYYEFAYGKEGINLTNYFRRCLFLSMKLRFMYYQDDEQRTPQNTVIVPTKAEALIRTKNIEWISCHSIHFRKYPSSQEGFIQYTHIERDNFYKLIEEQEKQGGDIMTIDEFEWAFIEYMRDKGMDI